MVNPAFQVEDANFMNNRGYVFRPNNNLPTHYHPGLINHENLSYAIKQMFNNVLNSFSSHNAPQGFQGQGASSSNYQGQKRQHSFEESVITLLNDMKRNHDVQGSKIVNLDKEQVNIKASLKTLENQMGQLALSVTPRNIP